MFDYARFEEHANFTDLTMYQFGQSKCKPGSMPGFVLYRHYLFHYVLSGKGLLQYEGTDGQIRQLTLSANQGFLMFPGYRCNYIADKEDPWHYTWVEFDGIKARDIVRRSGLTINHPVLSGKHCSDLNKLKESLLYLANNQNSPPLLLIAYLYLFANALVALCPNKSIRRIDNVKQFYIQEAVAFITQNYARELSVNEIADHCNIHRNYLSRIFKKAIGTTPQAFLVRHRCDIACDLLSMTNKPISEIGALVGYVNPLNFSRAFKREMGLSPKEYRKQI